MGLTALKLFNYALVVRFQEICYLAAKMVDQT
jgi:hypothetical protein